MCRMRCGVRGYTGEGGLNTKPQRPQSFYTKFSERMFEVHDFVFFVFHFPGFRNFQLVSQRAQSFSQRSERGFCNPYGHCVSSRSLRYIIRSRRPQSECTKVTKKKPQSSQLHLLRGPWCDLCSTSNGFSISIAKSAKFFAKIAKRIL